MDEMTFREFLEERRRYRNGEHRFIRIAGKLGIRKSALEVLGYLGRNNLGPESKGEIVGAIGENLGYWGAQMSRALNELEQRNLILRKLGTEDKRTMKIKMSDEGQREYLSLCKKFESSGN